ncbi:hypothetical protein UFOVP543_32 [uncultured Caudovirales phage]|jgi:hypothetical protein|uniref:Phage major capsid protein n=1 Tax=uncultured Caudovirales phage TaxID=2100421 RepID=A0A6J5MVB7_9CAUD|nr:hypothetical protein UFOVP543_32 [uncultured Caudovirales phage]CAB4163315.1 hypothetical protein UFOVP804_8 [uncultured Caudovirales phage]
MANTFSSLENTIASALDFHIKSDAFAQSIQEKPLLGLMTRKQKSFPGGKGDITIPVVFDYTTTIQGYEGDETVNYSNPQNTKRVTFPWKEIHSGISVTLTELKVDGISVSDSMTGESTSKHSGRDATVLTNILKAKLDDMTEGWSRGFNTMLWSDGSDTKKVAGIQAFIKPAATNDVGSTGGIARNSTFGGKKLWQNRTGEFTYVTAQTNIIEGLRKEVRQLKRYGGKPNVILCGSRFLELLEAEISSKGLFTQSGFAKGTDISIGVPSLLGLGEFVYDPTLDDLLPPGALSGNQSNYAYIIDTEALQLYAMEGEDKKVHNPARPENKYVIYKGMTWTGGMTAKRLNGCGLYIAND